jgi:hypothetical protein
MDHRTLARLSAAAALALALAPALAAEPAPPVPPLATVAEIGTVGQNRYVTCRDATYSALINGRSVWTFGDTCLRKGGVAGDTFLDNSVAGTANLDASKGITLERDLADSQHVPLQFIPLTANELAFNATHAPNEIALWPGQTVPDPKRHRELVFFASVYRGASIGFTPQGGGIAVANPTFTTVTRPVQNPDPNAPEPTYMWNAKEIAYTNGYVLDGNMLYLYGGDAVGLQTHVHVARVPLADALDKTKWTYFTGTGWSADKTASATIYRGGAAGDTVFFDAYLGVYVSVYQAYLSNDIVYRVADHPEGPWSNATLMYTARQGTDPSYAARVHTEFSEGGGRTIYVTYVMNTGLLQQSIQLVKATFQ